MTHFANTLRYWYHLQCNIQTLKKFEQMMAYRIEKKDKFWDNNANINNSFSRISEFDFSLSSLSVH